MMSRSCSRRRRSAARLSSVGAGSGRVGYTFCAGAAGAGSWCVSSKSCGGSSVSGAGGGTSCGAGWGLAGRGGGGGEGRGGGLRVQSLRAHLGGDDLELAGAAYLVRQALL